ncbi:MAG: hypothetical protein QNK42_14605 [Pseudodonghicola sp.]|nr:hypothetical protein [Pseudodonghicola sp.]
MRAKLAGLILFSVLTAAQAQAKEAQSQFTSPDYYDNRTSARDVLVSYYNAINLGQYARAYSYRLRGTPAMDAASLNDDYASFRDGYVDIDHVRVRMGEGFSDAGVGRFMTAIPVVIEAVSGAGGQAHFAGCHSLVQLSPSAQDAVPFDPIRMDHTQMQGVEGDFLSIPMPDCRF